VTAWQLSGACRGHDPNLWFSDDPVSIAAAQAVCAGCPVLVRCRKAGADEPDGVWGGVSAEERRDALIDEFMQIGFPEIVHDRTRYVEHGCRCGVCTEANRLYREQWLEKQRDLPAPVTRPGRVPDEQQALLGLEVVA